LVLCILNVVGERDKQQPSSSLLGAADEIFIAGQVARLRELHAIEVGECSRVKASAASAASKGSLPLHASIEVDPYPLVSLRIGDVYTLRLFPSDFAYLAAANVLFTPGLDLTQHAVVSAACTAVHAQLGGDRAGMCGTVSDGVVDALRANHEKLLIDEVTSSTATATASGHHWPTHGGESTTSWSPWLIGCSVSAATLDPERAALDAVLARCRAMTCTPDYHADLFRALRSALEAAFAPPMAEIGTDAGTDKVLDHGYHLAYDRFLSPLRGERVSLLEIGLERGSSVQLWRRLFPRSARIDGIDISVHPDCGLIKGKGGCVIGEGVTVFAGDGGSSSFLGDFANHCAASSIAYDVIVDDGSHVPADQLAAFRILFSRLLKPGGIYIIEDVETSYWHRRL
jgi:hypothetical protein